MDGVEFTLSMDGVDDENPLTVKWFKEFLNQFPDDTEIAADIGHAHNKTAVEVHDSWFNGKKKGTKLILIW